MQAALEIAAYVLGFTVLLGVALVGLLVKDLLFGQGFPVPRPAPQRLPTDALHEARDALRRLKAAHEETDGAGRQRLDLHLRRMRERVEHLEQKTIDDQSAYYRAVSLQERAWRHWKAVHTQVRTMTRQDRRRAQHHLQDAERHFRQIERQVADEWEKDVVRDRLNVEELRSLGLLDPGYAATLLRSPLPEPEAAPWDTLPPPPAAGAAPAAPRPDNQAAGMLTYRSLREIVRGALINWREATGRAVKRAIRPPRPGAAEAAGAAGAPAPAGGGTGEWHQSDLFDLAQSKAGRPYGDDTFSVADLPMGTLAQADLSGSTFTAVEFAGVHRHVDGRFIGADLRGIVLARQGRPHQFVRCNFAQADLSGARMTFLLFMRCNLTGTRWYGAELDRVKFTECLLEDVDWGGCDLSRTVFTEDARGADFSSAAAPPLFAAPTVEAPDAGDEPAPPGESPDPTTAAAGTAVSGETPPAQPQAAEPPPPIRGDPRAPTGPGRNG